MGFWQTIVLLAAIAASYLWAEGIFPFVAIAGGLLWFSTRHRTAEERRSSTEPTLAHEYASLLGIQIPQQHRGFRIRGGSVPLSVQVVAEGISDSGPLVLDLGAPGMRQVPFCFILRSLEAPHRFEDLVENSRIPGVKFEYELSRLTLPSPLEGASNQSDLMDPILDSVVRWSRCCSRTNGLRLQSVFFNGKVLHTRFDLDGQATPLEARQLLETHRQFLDDLWHLLDQVQFKAPL